METYSIVRMYFRDDLSNVTVKTGLTLEEAQEHCGDPETSSSTCSDSSHADIFGPWFDGYEEEN